MLSLKQPLSQEQKRLKVRDATRLLIEGEDFDYIRVKIRDTHGSTFNPAYSSKSDRSGCVRLKVL